MMQLIFNDENTQFVCVTDSYAAGKYTQIVFFAETVSLNFNCVTQVTCWHILLISHQRIHYQV